MKIAFFSSFYGTVTGGAEISVNLLKEGLLQNGINVFLYTTRKGICEENVFYIPRSGFHRKVIVFGSFIIDRLIAWQACKLLKKNIPDVIHAHDIYITPAAYLVAKKLRIPLVVTVRDEQKPRINIFNKKFVCTFPNYIYCKNDDNNLVDCVKCVFSKKSSFFSFGAIISPYRLGRSRTIFRALTKADKVIAISNFIKGQLNIYGIAQEKIEVIYNAAPDWENLSESNKSDIINLFTAGRIDEEKGFQTALSAIKVLVDKGKNVKLIIAGDGSYLNELKKIAIELKIASFVSFVGKRKFAELKNFYFFCDIVLFPTINAEPFGRIAVEALAAGKPIVASAVGGIPEIVIDEKTGFLFSPENFEMMADKIIRLIDSLEMRENMAKAAKERAVQVFNKNILAKKTIELYKKIISKNYETNEF